MSLSQTVFLEHLILHLLLHGVPTSLDDWNLPNKQFQSKSICFSSLLSRVNKSGYFRLSLQIRKNLFFMATLPADYDTDKKTTLFAVGIFSSPLFSRSFEDVCYLPLCLVYLLILLFCYIVVFPWCSDNHVC